jgi:hypothetical protein
MRETLDRGKDTHSPHLLTLLGSRLEQCQIVLDRLHKGLEPLSPELVKLHETLVSILRSTSAVNTRSKVRIVVQTFFKALTYMMMIVFVIRSPRFTRTVEGDSE